MSEAKSQSDDADGAQPDELTFIIEADRLQTTIGILRSAADECILTLGRDGFDVRLVNPGNNYMVDLALGADAFESVGDGRFTIGVNLGRFADILSKADSDGLVSLSLDVETRKFHIEYGNAELDVAGIDPDSVRNEPDLPDLDLPNAFECEAEHVQRALDICGLVSGDAALEGDVDAECIRFDASGDIDDASIELDDELEWANVTADARSLFGIEASSGVTGTQSDFLSAATGVIPAEAMLDVRFGTEVPMMIEWSYADGAGDVQQMVAPRVESGL